MAKNKSRWLREPRLGKNWLVAGDIEVTLKNLIKKMDRTWILLQNSDGFAEGLVDELNFIACYSEKESWKVRIYIDEHRDELYKFARKVTKFYPKRQ